MEDYSEYDLINGNDPNDHDHYQPPRIFVRSIENSVVSGVCGGIGNYFNVAPNLMRVIFVLLFIFGGWGIPVYIFLSLIMKIDPDPLIYSQDEIDVFHKADSKTLTGTVVIMTGLFFAIAPTGFWQLFGSFAIAFKYFVGFVLLGLGIHYLNNGSISSLNKNEINLTKLFRSREDKRFMGVCGGLARYLNLDSTMLRVLGVISLFITAGISFLVYLIFAYFVSYEPETADE